MSECLWAGGSGKMEYKIVAPSPPLLSCESSACVKENSDSEKSYTLIKYVKSILV